jgi:hypothetical protein
VSDKQYIKFNGFTAGAIVFLFFLFWAQSGWYRIDCALGTQKACELIAAEYIRKVAP